MNKGNKAKIELASAFLIWGSIGVFVKMIPLNSGVALTPKLWKYLSWVPRFAELLQQCRRTRKLLPQLAIPAQAFQSRHDVLVSPRSNHPLQRHPAICCTVLPDSDHFIYAPKDAQLLREVFIQLLRCAEETAER